MIVNDKKDLQETKRDVSGPGWSSLRLLVRSDKLGFSINDTIIKAGASLNLEYKNHLEACYCIEGTGEIIDHATDKAYPIHAGVIYALDQHDKHTITVDKTSDMRLVSVFNPALEGTEVHGPDGSYSA